MVEIYLNVHEDQTLLLSIPLRDIQRLSIRPLKWLRFVMFCVCGAKGQLSATPDGLPVDDNTGITSLTDDDIYYYMTGGKFFFCIQDEIEALHFQRHSSSWTLIV